MSDPKTRRERGIDVMQTLTGSEEAGPQAAADKANAASGTTLRRDRYLPGIAAVLLVTCRAAFRRGAALVPEATLRAGYDKKRGISRLVINLRTAEPRCRPLPHGTRMGSKGYG